MWSSIKENLVKVKKEIQDCRSMDGWDDHCQLMLRALYGMNYSDFYDFISYITKRRMNCLTDDKKALTVFGDWLIGPNYLTYDLKQLLKILGEISLDSDFAMLPIHENVKNLCVMLENFLEKL